jgi:hypothetical protein
MPQGILRSLLPSYPAPGAKDSRQVCPKHKIRFKSMGPGPHKCPACEREMKIHLRELERLERLERRREELERKGLHTDE